MRALFVVALVGFGVAGGAGAASCAASRQLLSSTYEVQAAVNPAPAERATAPDGIEAVCARGTLNYLIPTDDGGVILVDAGYDEDGTSIKLALRGRPVRAVLLTHGHLDHRAAAHHFDAPVYVGRGDVEVVEGSFVFKAYVPTLGAMFAGVPERPKQLVPVDDGFVLEVGGVRATALAVPGHTPGSVAWHVGRVVFGGDALQSPLGDEVYPAPPLVTEDMPRAYASLRRLRDVDFDVLLDGHFGRLDNAKAAVRRALSRRDQEEHPAFRPTGCTGDLAP